LHLKLDSKEAKRQIEALSGDPNSVETFQVFYPHKNAPREEIEALGFGYYENGEPKPGTYRIGTFDKYEAWLEHYNNLGCGVYIMVNKGDNKGRRANNVTKVRALFAEDDNGQQLEYSTLPPNLVIQSKKGEHCYWLLDDNQSISDFSLSQQTLISHFACDIHCKDVCRVLRLAGAWYVSDLNNPFQIKITHLDVTRKHTMSEIVAAYPAKTEIRTYVSTPEDLVKYESALAGSSLESREEQAVSYVQKYPPLISGFGERANRTLTLAARVYHEYGILDEAKTYEILKRWNSNSPDPWSENELRNFVHNAANFSGHAAGRRLLESKSIVSPESADWLENVFGQGE
jgi:hypothetical protein